MNQLTLREAPSFVWAPRWARRGLPDALGPARNRGYIEESIPSSSA